MHRITTKATTILFLLACISSNAQEPPNKGSSIAGHIGTAVTVIGDALGESDISKTGAGISLVNDARQALSQAVKDARSDDPKAGVTVAVHLANSGIAQVVGGVTGTGVKTGLLTLAATRNPQASVMATVAVSAASSLLGGLAGDWVKDATKASLDASYDETKPKPEEPPMFQGSQDGKGLSQADMMKNARSVFQTFADANGDLPEHRDEAYKKIAEMNSKPKGLDYDSEPHTLKYGNGAQILGDQRGQQQGVVDFSDRGSMLPNRVAEPNASGTGSGASRDATMSKGGNSVQSGSIDRSAAENSPSANTSVRSVMLAVRKRNIEDKIKNAPSNRPPGFEQAVSKLLKMAESEAFLKQDDALEARIKAGDANAIQFFEFAKSYASGQGTSKDFEAMLKRFNVGSK